MDGPWRLAAGLASTAAAVDRARERHSRIARTALSAVLPKAINLITVLISVPLALGYLGEERYGLWMTIASLTTVLAFADLGLGYGLMNAIAEANGRDDRELARTCVASGLAMLGALALGMILVFAVTYPLVPWGRLLNVSSAAAAREAGPAVAVLVVCFALNLPCAVVQRVQMGYQEGYVNNLWQSGGNLLGLLGVLGAIHFHAGLPWLVVGLVGAPLLTGAANGVVLFRYRRPWLRPSVRDISRPVVKRIIHLGSLFFVLQVAVALAFASDNLIAARVLGAAAVTEYAVTVQLFGIVSALLGMALTPLWPAYAEALVRRDVAWVRQTLRRSADLAVSFSAIFSLLLILFGREIISIWTDGRVSPSSLLLIGCGVWKVLEALGNALSMFLNGANVVRLQVTLALLMAVAAVFSKILLARLIGVPGVVWGTVLAYSLFCLLPLAWFIPRLLARL